MAEIDAGLQARRKLPPHLDWVELHEFSENVPREHGEERSGRCQAFPAEAFRPKYPECLRRLGHRGPHSAVEATARRMDERDRRRANAG